MKTCYRIAGFVVAFVCMTSVASAAVVFSDDFPGTALDGAKWTTVAGSPSVSGSVLSLANATEIESVATFNPSDGDYTINLTGWGPPQTSGGLVGFSDATGDNSILFRTDKNSATIQVSMTSGGGATQSSALQMNTATFFQNNWTVTVNASRVTLAHDIAGWMTSGPFDTDTASPGGGGGWNIPTVDMNFTVFTNGFSSASTLLDAVSIDLVLVPEPGTFALASLGGLMFLRRRRHV